MFLLVALPSKDLSQDARGHGAGSAAKNFVVCGRAVRLRTGTTAVRGKLDFARKITAPADIIPIVNAGYYLASLLYPLP